MTTIEKIHNEIDTAQDRLIDNSTRIIEENRSTDVEQAILNKAERLKSVGFTNTVEIEKADNINKNGLRVISTQEQDDLLMYYKNSYPFSKFLTIGELDRICKKYGLIYAPVERYKKEVPEKNLKEIEERKKMISDDLPRNVFKVKYKVSDWNIYKNIYVTKNDARHWKKSVEIDAKKEEIDEYDLRQYLLEKYKFSKRLTFKKINIKKENRRGLFIAAPKGHFDLKGLKKNRLGYYFHVSRTIETDPIVFQYCRGNMVRVITKWGIEANDPSLVLPINN